MQNSTYYLKKWFRLETIKFLGKIRERLRGSYYFRHIIQKLAKCLQLINVICRSERDRDKKKKMLFSTVIKTRIAYENRMANRLVDTRHTFRKWHFPYENKWPMHSTAVKRHYLYHFTFNDFRCNSVVNERPLISCTTICLYKWLGEVRMCHF